MTKTNGTGDNAKAITGKNQSSDTKTNDINRQYEKALESKDKPKRDAKNSRALGVPPKKQKLVTEKKIQERQQARSKNTQPNNRQNQILNKRESKNTSNPNLNVSINNNSDHDDDDDASHTDKNKREKKQINTDPLNNSLDFSQNHHHHQDDENDVSDKKNNRDNYQNNQNIPIMSKASHHGTEKNLNKQDYADFLKNFVTNFHAIPQNEIVIQKAMVQDTISQMFDQFLVGMNSFDKSTKQHQMFGQGANLCQKILVSLKNDNMNDALGLIKRIIPKG